MFNKQLKEEMRLTRLMVEQVAKRISEIEAKIEFLEVRCKKLEVYR